MKSEVRKSIEGYSQIAYEMEICRKYGIDYTAQKGRWKAAVERLHPKRLQLRVAKIITETGTTSTLRLVPVSGYLPPFQAGQYINLFVDIDGVRTARPYSISSPPNQTAYYDITVRRVADGFVSSYLLDQVKVGDVLETTGPAGQFYYNPLIHGKDLVFLAGGSGITPFMSMIREVTDRLLLDRKIHLIYGSRSPQEAIFHKELMSLAADYSNFSYDLVISDPGSGYEGLTGLIDADLIISRIGSVEGKTFFICGPQEMYAFTIPELKELGVPDRRIRRELFGLPKQVYNDPAWPKEVSPQSVFTVKLSSGREIPARADEPLLVSMERAGLVIENCCRSGECSLCRVKLVKGQVFHARTAKLRKSDHQAGYIHSCAAYPISDVEIML
ncbi:MAG TPA: FAD-binding oxidoreductase [Syntrophomonadaceae bacterium]|nr:FAD-binding oxidoreductase [Syntrophomonadaceae bacterium]HQD90301.1 FAD-binding oxidoreductase [Syntrophomonadaceae bacterium]